MKDRNEKQTTDTHIAWFYNENCNRPGKTWNPEETSPIFSIGEWEFSNEDIASGRIEWIMKEKFGSEFPAGDLTAITGTYLQLENQIYGTYQS